MSEPGGWKLQFGSDTVAGVCPEAMQALIDANGAGFLESYGDDSAVSAKARGLICDLFGKTTEECTIFFVSSGTVANALAVVSACRPFDAVACHPMSHLASDEANAVEHLTGGARLLDLPVHNGKIDPDGLDDLVERGHGQHSARLRMISLTQATEVGTVYTIEEIKRILDKRDEIQACLQKRFGDPNYRLSVHVDGARFANAVASLECDPRHMVQGIDVLSFGGSKNGGPPTEAIVFFNQQLAQQFVWHIKQTGQLTSKMRYLSAPWIGMLDKDVWLRNARHANQQARRLGERFTGAGADLLFPIEANMLFARMTDSQAARLAAKGWHFHPFQFPDGLGVGQRFVCNWQTTDEAIDDLAHDFDDVMSQC